MSDTEDAIWARLKQIPSGRVCSYGDLANSIGRPGYARAVGRLLSRNPEPIIVPCHRVVRSDGRLGGYMGDHKGAERKKELLEAEGVEVVEGWLPRFMDIRFQDFPPL
ncbi:MAG: MGMT family protein [Candidatus Methanomethylophilaceae archaeon]|jgi:O-6-methylguanine DNA methyltransferase